MDEISGSQSHLTEKLRLLQELGYSDIYMHEDSPAVFRYRSVDDWDTDSDLCVLDVIAACLTTGKPGDVVAAAFDKREQISLVLAKSGNIDSADYAATRAFLSALREAESWINLLPFLATHSKQNVDKRVRNLHESITDLCDELKSTAMSYKFSSIEDQFPRSSLYRKAKYPKESPTPQRFLFDIIGSCVSRSTGFDMQDNASSRSQYIQLFGAADSLRHAAFLAYLASKYYEEGDSTFKGRVERLKRHLDKVCQYAKIETLMRLAKRFPSVPFRWIEDQLVGRGEGSLEICKDPMKVMEQVLGHSPSPQQTCMLLQRYPELGKNWEQRRSINLCIHPEIRIVLHLSRPLLTRFLSSRNDSKHLPIGCSKRSCLCCMLWIASFNEVTRMLWVTSGSNGKPYDNWALPGAAGEMKLVPSWDKVDAKVLRGIHWRLYGKLNTICIWASDDFVLPNCSEEMPESGHMHI
ncbi:hypothetical protein Hypma_007332 [Hypsizygus marmoreus]|uniref:Uncharacterized protein n=1 Tax=Hypsizygus marmoreus TaxID=39966 RepID=A0A151V6W8_HYPMA|nr:hypothetical protein Hypma_003417 [Hypsizygus marmoreus]RDB30230.1 hypothetical protein Hypma_007332 [Hypsizygus marmoreus]